MSNDDETVARVAHAISGALIAAFKAGWGNSAEGYNAEYGPLDDDVTDTAIEETKEFALIAARAALSAMPGHEMLRETLSALEPFAKEAAEWGVNGKPLPDDFQVEVREAGYPATPALFNLGDLRRARAAADKIRAALEHHDKGEKL